MGTLAYHRRTSKYYNFLETVFSKKCDSPSTLGFLAEISFTPLLYHPGGPLGCSENRTSSRNYVLFALFGLLFFSQNGMTLKNLVKSYCFCSILWFLLYKLWFETKRICQRFVNKKFRKQLYFLSVFHLIMWVMKA